MWRVVYGRRIVYDLKYGESVQEDDQREAVISLRQGAVHEPNARRVTHFSVPRSTRGRPPSRA